MYVKSLLELEFVIEDVKDMLWLYGPERETFDNGILLRNTKVLKDVAGNNRPGRIPNCYTDVIFTGSEVCRFAKRE